MTNGHSRSRSSAGFRSEPVSARTPSLPARLTSTSESVTQVEEPRRRLVIAPAGGDDHERRPVAQRRCQPDRPRLAAATPGRGQLQRRHARRLTNPAVRRVTLRIARCTTFIVLRVRSAGIPAEPSRSAEPPAPSPSLPGAASRRSILSPRCTIEALHRPLGGEPMSATTDPGPAAPASRRPSAAPDRRGVAAKRAATPSCGSPTPSPRSPAR